MVFLVTAHHFFMQAEIKLTLFTFRNAILSEVFLTNVLSIIALGNSYKVANSTWLLNGEGTGKSISSFFTISSRLSLIRQ